MGRRADKRLGDLYRRHADQGMRMAFLLTGDQAAAEDIVHDAFVRLFARYHDLRRADAFEIYLRRTIVNLSRDRFRRRRLERDHTTREAGTLHQASIESAVEDRDSLRRGLASLPHRQKAAIVLRFYVDLSERETAEVLQCSVPAVKSLVTRATASLSKRMGGELT